MIYRANRAATHFYRAFYCPITRFLALKAAGIADKFFQFSILIFSARYAYYVFAFIPKGYLSAAFITTAMSVYRLRKPNAIFKTECFIGQSSHRTYINHVS